MKLTRTHLRRIIGEEYDSLARTFEHESASSLPRFSMSQIREMIIEEAVAFSLGDANTQKRAGRVKAKWDALDIKNTRRPESDPAADDFLRTLWDNTESSWAKSKGLTTGGKGDPAGPAWSAATISTIVDDPGFQDSIRHSDYRKQGQTNRKKWDAASDEDKSKIDWVAFKPDEIETAPGDLRCYPREGGTHCDVCMDAECGTIVGGNIGDDLVSRGSSSAPEPDMYIVKNAKAKKSEKKEEKV